MKAILLLLALGLVLQGCVLGGEGNAYADFGRVLAKYGVSNEALMPGREIDLKGFESELQAVKEKAGMGSREARALSNAVDVELDMAGMLLKSLEGREKLAFVGVLQPDCSKDGAAAQARAAFEVATAKAKLAIEKRRLLEKDYKEFMSRFPNLDTPAFESYVGYLGVSNAAAAKQLEARCKK